MSRFTKQIWMHLGLMAIYFVIAAYGSGLFSGDHLSGLVMMISWSSLYFLHMTGLFIASLLATKRGEAEKAKELLGVFLMVLLIGFSVCSVSVSL